jgi:hypothetical protein
MSYIRTCSSLFLKLHHRAPQLVVLSCRPELVQRNPAQSAPAFVLRSERRSMSPAFVLNSTSSVIGHYQTTRRIGYFLFQHSEQIGECTHLANVQPEALTTPVRYHELLLNLILICNFDVRILPESDPSLWFGGTSTLMILLDLGCTPTTKSFLSPTVNSWIRVALFDS